MRDLATFPERWVGCGMPGVHSGYSTYFETPLRNMSSVDVREGLNWLLPLYARVAGDLPTIQPDADSLAAYAANAKAIGAQAARTGVVLPVDFEVLISNAEIQNCFPTATACYLDLPARIAPAPFGLGGHIVRFLNDQQVCVIWYLYFPQTGEPVVIASYPGNDYLFLEDLSDAASEIEKAAIGNIRLVSHTFSEFLYRFWIENIIWFKYRDGIPLTEAESDYLKRLQPSSIAD